MPEGGASSSGTVASRLLKVNCTWSTQGSRHNLGLITTGMVPSRPARVLKVTREAILFEEGCTADDTLTPPKVTETLPGKGRNAICTLTSSTTSLSPEAGVKAVTAGETATYVYWKTMARSGCFLGVTVTSTSAEDALPSVLYSGVTSVNTVASADDDLSWRLPATSPNDTSASAAEESSGNLAMDTRMKEPPISGPETADLTEAIGTRSSYTMREKQAVWMSGQLTAHEAASQQAETHDAGAAPNKIKPYTSPADSCEGEVSTTCAMPSTSTVANVTPGAKLPTSAEYTEGFTSGALLTVMVTSEDLDMGTLALVCPTPSGPETDVTCGRASS
mmetsp:Transcript_32750/g.74667  ORF Transcript_32750/g.74667 Transcript_32750/m.74667 type:complete len:334 (+) Transcript_32750:463-1464(+)